MEPVVVDSAGNSPVMPVVLQAPSGTQGSISMMLGNGSMLPVLEVATHPNANGSLALSNAVIATSIPPPTPKVISNFVITFVNMSAMGPSNTTGIVEARFYIAVPGSNAFYPTALSVSTDTVAVDAPAVSVTLTNTDSHISITTPGTRVMLLLTARVQDHQDLRTPFVVMIESVSAGAQVSLA
jgi:hypothetical protein